jgi:hypothetical protein
MGGWGSRRSGGVAERRSLPGGRDVEARAGGDHGVSKDLAPLLEAAVEVTMTEPRS